MSKINVWIIIRDHFKTLKDLDRATIGVQGITIFFVIPIFVAALLVLLGVQLTENFIAIIIACYTILTGLLLNLLLIIFDIIKSSDRQESLKDISAISDLRLKMSLLKETFANISFAILLSICLAFFAVCGLFNNGTVVLVASFLVFLGTINFIMTLLMVLKRFHTIVSMELNIKTR